MRCRSMTNSSLCHFRSIFIVLAFLLSLCSWWAFWQIKSDVLHLEEIFFKRESERNLMMKYTHDQAVLHNSHQSNHLTYNPKELLVIYNRIPKTGSTSLAGIAYDLCNINNFHAIHLNITKNSHIMSLADQTRFVENITNWHSKKPAFYHGHMAFLDFKRFGIVQQPIYINIIRDPLDRLISYYYFIRNGDNFRPYLKRRKMGDKESFDECVRQGNKDCDPQHLWLQIPFFCGQNVECWNPGSRWALSQAKHNVVNNYLTVGVTEELGDFIAVLEATLPSFFRGAADLFNTGTKSHLRKTTNKIKPKPETVAKIQTSDIWKMEDDFYQFVKENFHSVKERTFEIHKGYMLERTQQFHFEKIRPVENFK